LHDQNSHEQAGDTVINELHTDKFSLRRVCALWFAEATMPGSASNNGEEGELESGNAG